MFYLPHSLFLPIERFWLTGWHIGWPPVNHLTHWLSDRIMNWLVTFDSILHLNPLVRPRTKLTGNWGKSLLHYVIWFIFWWGGGPSYSHRTSLIYFYLLRKIFDSNHIKRIHQYSTQLTIMFILQSLLLISILCPNKKILFVTFQSHNQSSFSHHVTCDTNLLVPILKFFPELFQRMREKILMRLEWRQSWDVKLRKGLTEEENRRNWREHKRK
jgi:hypothetical protein